MIKNPLLLGFLVFLGCHEEAEPLPGFQGVMEHETRDLGFEVGGQVDRVEVLRGARVKAGDLLVGLDVTLPRLALEARSRDAEAAKARAELVAAGPRDEDLRALAARVRAAGATVTQLARELEREKQLHGRGATPAARTDDLKSELDRARAERASLAHQLRSLRAGARNPEIEAAHAQAEAAARARDLERARLSRYELRAPADGTIDQVSAKTGEIVAPGQIVITLVDRAEPYADVFVPEGEIAPIHVGLRARARVDSLPSTFEGTVEHIADETEFTPRFLFSERERSNLVIRVRVRIHDPKRALHAGVPVFVTFESDT